jgi:broad specificity phosphatase PhoE
MEAIPPRRLPAARRAGYRNWAMSKLVDLIRHGQSTFNAAFAESRIDPLHYDARLTPLGHAQVAAARATVRANDYDLIVTSPFSRAIETTCGLFDTPAIPILVEALHRERLESSCDTDGRPPSSPASFQG